MNQSQNNPNAKTPALEDIVDQFAEKLDALKLSYEKYFLGIDRKAPQKDRSQIEREMNQLLTVNTNNTMVRFRIQNLKAKLVTYQTHWDRCMKQMEDGTFHRDRFRLKLYDQRQKEKSDLEPVKSDKGIKASPEKAAEKAQDKAAEKSAKRNSNIETLLSQYVEARKKSGEKTDGINYDSFAKTLTQQTAALKERYKCKSVRFKVVIENGKTKLKATPV